MISTIFLTGIKRLRKFQFPNDGIVFAIPVIALICRYRNKTLN